MVSAINMSLAFCMGTDLQALSESPQPMAAILRNSFGEKGTLAVWAIVVLVQYVLLPHFFWAKLSPFTAMCEWLIYLYPYTDNIEADVYLDI